MPFRHFFIVLSVLVIFKIWADTDIDTQDIGSEKITDAAKHYPFSFNAYVDVVAPTKIAKGFFEKDKVSYAEAEVEVDAVVYYCAPYTEGIRLGAGFTATYLRWAENPWFDQDHFYTLNLTLAGFTKRFSRWFWRSQLTANIDTEEWCAAYTSYDILLWGRYAFCDNLGIHLGFLAQTGLYLDRVYPIIGADWQISRDWKLNLVYPVNVSLSYALTSNWFISIAGRMFSSRFRVHKDEIFPKQLVRYTNTGVELAIKYETDNISANIHAGTTFGGNYRVSNKHNNDARNFKLEASAYAGCEMSVAF